MSERRRGLFGLFNKKNEDPVEPAPETPAAPSQTEMRLRIADFEKARVEDVMIPRAEIIGVELSTNLEDLIQLYASEAHSRLPVYRETLDDPVGVVHIRDVVSEIASFDVKKMSESSARVENSDQVYTLSCSFR